MEDSQLLASGGIGAKEHRFYLSIGVERQRLELQCCVGLDHDPVCIIHTLNGEGIFQTFDDVPGLDRLLLNK